MNIYKNIVDANFNLSMLLIISIVIVKYDNKYEVMIVK